MPSREQLVSQDISTPEIKSSESGLEIAQNTQLESAVSKANEIAESIQQDKPVTAEQVLELEKDLGNLKVNIGGEEMTMAEARKIPDLKMNMRIWEEIKTGKYDRMSEITHVSSEIVKILIKSERIFLPQAHSFSKSAIELLGTVKNRPLFLDGLREISDYEAECLGNHVGTLFLRNVITLSDSQAEHLSHHVGNLRMDNLSSLSDKGAAQFINFQQHIEVPFDIKDQIARLKQERDEEK